MSLCLFPRMTQIYVRTNAMYYCSIRLFSFIWVFNLNDEMSF
jgi:hypothetical protein